MPEDEICNLCKVQVEDEEDGLLCEGCWIWKHRICLAMSEKTYIKLNKSDAIWYCSTGCKTKVKTKRTQGKPNNKTDGHTLADVMDKLNRMEDRYNELLDKYKEQIAINTKLNNEVMQLKGRLDKLEQNNVKAGSHDTYE